MLRMGLTGGIGAGKSTVSAMLASFGALVIDADAIAREIVEPGEPALDEIVARFGTGVLRADGGLDRAALASIVFTDAEALAALNAITHPRIAERTADLIGSAPPDAVVVYDMPLLVENGLADGWDLVVVVDAPDELRLARLEGRGMAEAEARARMAAQATREDRIAIADVVIDNSGPREHAYAQVEELWHRITRGPVEGET